MNNSYVIREDFLRWVTPQDTTADAVDDSVIDSILEAASRYFDGETVRSFYPSVETDYFNIPDDRELIFGKDYLSLISLTNGDGTAIASTEYNMIPRNITPHFGLRLKSSSSIYWETDSDGESEYVIKAVGETGCHENYSTRAWKTNDTLDASGIADTTTKTFGVTGAPTIKVGYIIKIGTEIMNVSAISGSDITVSERGANGSTAAIHAAGESVYIWNTQADVVLAVKLIAQSVYRRFGAPNQGDESIVTASGVIITPKDVPGLAVRTIRRYRRLT